MENNTTPEANLGPEDRSEKEKFVKTHNWQPDEDNSNKKEKLHLPKRKFAIIHGYNGHDFKGNQK